MTRALVMLGLLCVAGAGTGTVQPPALVSFPTEDGGTIYANSYGYSAHADRRELHKWIDAVKGAGKAPPVWLVHGEPTAQDALAADLKARGYQPHTPSLGDRATF